VLELLQGLLLTSLLLKLVLSLSLFLFLNIILFLSAKLVYNYTLSKLGPIHPISYMYIHNMISLVHVITALSCLSLAAPEAVLPPLLTSLSARSVEIRFTAPLLPNGMIIRYTITRLPPSPSTITFTPDTLPDLESDEFYTHVDQNLNPFTTYNYTLTVCTNGGCTESIIASVMTLEATPTGVAAPMATTQSFSEIETTWSAPQMPNGIIQSYILLRKFLGFESVDNGLNCCEDFLRIASPGSNGTLADVCQLVTMTTTEVTAHTDDELRPYTFYQYCILAMNNADSAFSPQTPPTRTAVAPMPLIGPELNATTVNSTAIELVWGSLEVSELLGPLVEYTLYIKVAGDQGLGEVLLRGLDQFYTAVNLLASTEYVFVVSVSNGEGIAFGNNASALTDEGSKFNLSLPLSLSPSLPPRPSIFLSFSLFPPPPLSPNASCSFSLSHSFVYYLPCSSRRPAGSCCGCSWK
jgi:usherin